MSRQVVSLLLVPSLLLAQSAIAFDHSHGGNEPTGHETRAHVHIGGHAHDDGHHHGHHHHHKERGDTSKLVSQPNSCPLPLSDHDSDAVYFPQIDATTGTHAPVEITLAAAPVWAAVAGNTLTLHSPSWSQHATNWIHAPPSRCADPLYLCHLALLL